jgi:undecaprenyl-diphosphatase
MTIFQAIIYGLVQGIGEFLPISSSGHLVLLPYFFHWTDPGLTFDVALHFGTLIAVCGYFRKDFFSIIKNFFKFDPLRTGQAYPKFFILILAIGSVPGALAGALFDDYAEKTLRGPLVIAAMLSLFGFMLYWFDKKYASEKNLGDVTAKQALLIGLAQAMAIVPGVSRSGSTITAGRFLHLDRSSAARFSFLLSAPIIFGATILKFGKFIKAGVHTPEIAAIMVSAISGYFAISFLLKFVQVSSYKVFFWYRLFLAGLILLFYYQSL